MTVCCQKFRFALLKRPEMQNSLHCSIEITFLTCQSNIGETSSSVKHPPLHIEPHLTGTWICDVRQLVQIQQHWALSHLLATLWETFNDVGVGNLCMIIQYTCDCWLRTVESRLKEIFTPVLLKKCGLFFLKTCLLNKCTERIVQTF